MIFKTIHNFRRTLSECEDGIIFCAYDSASCAHYGDIHRIADLSSARLDDGTAARLAIAYYGSIRTSDDTYTDDDIRACVYPSHIVESAGAWDDVEYLNHLEDMRYFDNFDAILTPDGAIVFDQKFMEVLK